MRRIVGRLTDGLILVVQPEKNHRRLVLRAVASLASLGVGLVGVVANKIGAEKKRQLLRLRRLRVRVRLRLWLRRDTR